MLVQSFTVDRQGCRIAGLELREIFRRRDPTNNPVCSIRQRGLVDYRVEYGRFDAFGLTPVLRKDMVNIDVLTKEHDVVKFLPGTKIAGAVPHQQRVHTLVRRR
jgi:hypothetical protein